jgi:hypothetical protein
VPGFRIDPSGNPRAFDDATADAGSREGNPDVSYLLGPYGQYLPAKDPPFSRPLPTTIAGRSLEIATPCAWTATRHWEDNWGRYGGGDVFAIASRRPAAATEEAPQVDRALAIRLMEALQAAEPDLDSLSALSTRVSDESRRRRLRRQIGEVMSSHVYMTMSVVCQFRDLDPDREDLNAQPLRQTSGRPVDRSNLEIAEVLRAAEADLGAVAALADHIGDQDEREEFRTHIVKASTLYREIMDAVVHGLLPELGCGRPGA